MAKTKKKRLCSTAHEGTHQKHGREKKRVGGKDKEVKKGKKKVVRVNQSFMVDFHVVLKSQIFDYYDTLKRTSSPT